MLLVITVQTRNAFKLQLVHSITDMLIDV